MSGDQCGGGGPPGSGDDSGGGWETVEKKSKKSAQQVRKGQWGQWNSATAAAAPAAAWSGSESSRHSGNTLVQHSDRRPAGRGNPRPPPQIKSTEADQQAPRRVVTAPLESGWQWGARPGAGSKEGDLPLSGCDPETDNAKGDDDTSDDDDNDDYMSDDMSDDFDSDGTEKSFETRKKHKLLKSFFEVLETLSVEQLNEPTRQWHCPACKHGPGAIDWYKGLQPLMAHAKTKGSIKVRLHRELAELLERELSLRGTSVVPAGEQFHKWKGLEESTDREIVWPPMVIVMNTLLEQDEDDKWKGMGNQELIDYFSEYAASKARHAYGPNGHRGMSVLIFDSSAVGYMEADRLHEHFVRQRTDRVAWQKNNRVKFVPGGKRQLYGFLARKDDMEEFNRHCHGKSRLKFELRSYNEMVVTQLKQMSEDNQQLNYLKNKMVKKEQHSKLVEETLGVVTQKLRETMEENKIVRKKAKEKHLEYEKEMKFQEQFFHDQIEKIHKATEEKEIKFEQLLQEERIKARRSEVGSGSTEDRRQRKEEIEKFIDCQVKDVEEFEAERDKLIKLHEEKKVKLKREYMEKEVELEKELDAALTNLMDKHKPDIFQSSSSRST
ncbi:protein SUPPRESSOR OF GENE SILENCING 3 homolog [Oryza brachyantha]|uniref:Protein SUPPRESSOR OF GENE SILENCING 3 n=1 Tax=Oryza brachyantha TaxID=4533 RepID=J3NC29_ORYBR|nr:protein SUPPRESSOR OF GENE SILENCING 3 homolog [Oryza brachyantha]